MAAASVHSNRSYCFSGAVSSGSLAERIIRGCRLPGCERIIEIEPLSRRLSTLMHILLQNENGLAVKIVSFFFLTRETGASRSVCAP